MDDLEEVAEDEHEEVGGDITLELKNTDGSEELEKIPKIQLKIVSITLILFFKN